MNNPLHLRYWLGPADYLMQAELLHAKAFRDVYANVKRELVEYLVVCVLGVVASYLAQNIFLVIAFIVLGMYKLTWSHLFRRKFQEELVANAQKNPPREIELVVDVEGLHETAQGIKSFAPWSAVKSHVKFKETFFLELAGGLWAIIPAAALGGTSSRQEQQLVEALQRNGVPARGAQG